MDKKDIRQLLASQPASLPIFSTTALKLQSLLSHEDYVVQDVVSIANEDPALVSQMLKIANSPLYSGWSKVENLKEVIVRLGARQVVSIAIAAAHSAAHDSHSEFFRKHYARLWSHSHSVALGAKWLAIACGLRSQAENAYLCGLLHDVGKLFLLKSYESLVERKELPEPSSDDDLVGILDTMHSAQGSILLSHWNFPELYVKVTRDHHPDGEPTDRLLAIIQLVNWRANLQNLGYFSSMMESYENSVSFLKLADGKLEELDAYLLDSVEK